MYEEERKAMVTKLESGGYIKSTGVRQAMETIPRHIFIPEEMQRFAHADTPMSIGEGQTISAPHMVAMMLEILGLKKGMKVLEVGCGSGYHASLAAYLVGAEGHVFTIDIIESLTQKAKVHISQIGLHDRITVIHADGSRGLPEEAPFDRIMAACSAPEVPHPLIDQLADPGIAVIPVGTGYSQNLAIVRKVGGKITRSEEKGVAFVPMRGEYGR
ncbi:MAG: protein-L-isoaspartate(D-aspartate) O-methyltransferase [Candidatus Thermoplasmatota archaeon]|nr:protein-L-isoaspartate(D-aspartate) O-methyltransferase [Candidatus Thermoplasmatota archaeon]MBU4070653.1 protein-L-isoaspartate(D-aspartate) O-methyltransferase [Candidatus Thermoplasmatota archaeon]MBU4145095.1 protein-L-isoaspartate(D-aspartate) O-methyltransferase [Candidatus Thermoplasmatota archaeon]MBU4592228.1 protein-L-isoaspartate(D-aspartate) O-methyltransferase [Candidatus Thermoplasmatota archaeon]